MTLRQKLAKTFPFLRLWHSALMRVRYRMRMRLDGNRYAAEKEACLLPHVLQRYQSTLINPNTGYPMEYQRNKVYNLRLACPTADHLLIRPGETFSFWRLVGQAERMGRFRDGLCLVNGQIEPVRGGGLCQLSNLLYALFLHTPLTVTERHPHSTESFPPPPAAGSPTDQLPAGVDATVSEGRADREPEEAYRLFTQDEALQKEEGALYHIGSLWRARLDPLTGEELSREKLYDSRQRLDYDLPEQDGGQEVVA